MPVRRQIKNVVYKYTDIEIKVREATSNDPWGPSSTLMAELADTTYNVVAFTEMMHMIVQRLNDKSKNWRHVYKALILLDYLVKTGSEKVSTQVREDIHIIDTLTDFEYFEDNKDHGQNVRLKAKALASLLRNEDQLQDERAKALRARERLNYSRSSAGDERSNTYSRPIPTSTDNYGQRSHYSGSDPSMDSTYIALRPQNVGEEQLQLQLALALSKEEHDQTERIRKLEEAKDAVKLRMAMEQSCIDGQKSQTSPAFSDNPFTSSQSASGVNTFGSGDDPFSPSSSWQPFTSTDRPHSTANQPADPWLPDTSSNSDPFSLQTNTGSDIWSMPMSSGPVQTAPISNNDELDLNRSKNNGNSDMLQDIMSPISPDNTSRNGSSNLLGDFNFDSVPSENAPVKDEPPKRGTAADFLGDFKGLVDLDKLIDTREKSSNPFYSPPENKPTLSALVRQASPFEPAQPAPSFYGGQTTQMYPGFLPTQPVFMQPNQPMLVPAQPSPWAPVSTNMVHPSQHPNPTSLNPFS